jgi:hypothetical protein
VTYTLSFSLVCRLSLHRLLTSTISAVLAEPHQGQGCQMYAAHIANTQKESAFSNNFVFQVLG